jgi:dipeptidyl aminopeptidase/acylaminoacyl peptidase
MGAPPWEVPDRYVRNSPFILLDRIRTPLLMVAADFDSAMGQAEEVYTGLYRLGRPVRFVRYFGEDHVIDSPANIRHLWGELFSWFDEHLRY